MTRKPPENLEELLVLDEGEVLHAYQDSLGYWTIGVGHLIDKRRGGGISKKFSRLLLYEDINAVQSGLNVRWPKFCKLDPVRQAVFTSMAFQLGVSGAMQFKKTLGLVDNNQFEAAAKEMLNSAWAKQTPNRAQRLSQQLATGEWV